MTKKLILISQLLAYMVYISPLHAQYTKEETAAKRCFVGSSLFVLANLVPDDNSPDFGQLNFGYRLNQKNVISIELKTWKYAWPLGIPLGSNSYEASGENFPGYIREYGFALAYQRYWWRGLYSAFHVMNAWQTFADENGEKVGNGFQIFNTYRILGYHIKLFNNRFFIEPSIAITHRPFHTDMPEAFKRVDDKWPKFFVGEPGLHIGVNF